MNKKLFIPLVAIVIALVSMTIPYEKDMVKPEGGLNVGDFAPDFKLKNALDDQMVSLSDAKYQQSKGVVVIFTCNHCPFAKAYEDRIIALHREYENKGFPVIAINPNNPAKEAEDSYDKMKERASEKGFTFPYLFDDGQKVYPAYGATKTPHVYLLQRVGTQFRVEYIGSIDDSARDAAKVDEKYLENAINSVIKGKKPRPVETKAIGCGIKA